MKISERTKRLLNWWQLRIEKSREETKEKNVERNDSTADSANGIRMGSKDKERQRVKKGEE